MIWQLIEVMMSPEDWAVTVRNGELYIERIDALIAKGINPKG